MLAAGPGGITTANDSGLYAVARSGATIELLRESKVLLGKAVKNFNVIQSVAGSAGAARSFNANAQVAVLVTFSDNSTAIVNIDVP